MRISFANKKNPDGSELRTKDSPAQLKKTLFSSQRSFEYLRLTSLGVIGALVKTDENDVINFLLTTEIVPLCLNIMETGSELSKTVATFILQKILVDNAGLEYICAVSFFCKNDFIDIKIFQTYERFCNVAIVLEKMVVNLSKVCFRVFERYKTTFIGAISSFVKTRCPMLPATF